MKTAINLITTFLLIPWGGILMMSPMMLASKGFRDSPSSIGAAMLFLGYPVIIFIVHKLFGWTFWGIKANTTLLVSGVFIGLVFLVYGFPKMLFNLNKGIPNEGYFVAENSVYLDGEKIPDAIASSFEVMKSDHRYARDEKHVFYFGKLVEGANPTTFVPIDNYNKKDEIFGEKYFFYWSDGNRIFHVGDVLENSDPKTFQPEWPFAWDAHNVYYQGKRLVKSKPEHFRVLKDGIALDGNSVIIYGKYSSLKVDQETFEVIDHENGMYCKDKNNIYVLLLSLDEPLVKVKDADLDTFEPLERSYARDKNRVYYYGYTDRTKLKLIVLEDADPSSFTVGYDEQTDSEATDGTRYWMNGKRVK